MYVLQTLLIDLNWDSALESFGGEVYNLNRNS